MPINPYFAVFTCFFLVMFRLQSIVSVHHRKRANKKSTIVRGGDRVFEASPWGHKKNQPAAPQLKTQGGEAHFLRPEMKQKRMKSKTKIDQQSGRLALSQPLSENSEKLTGWL